MAQEQPTPAPQKQLLLQKIYVKDLSFESPKAPMVFTQNVSPQTQLNVRSSAQQVAPDTQEVTLTITVEAKDKDSTLFLAEVAQAGIFVIQGYTAEEQQILIGSFCPNTLYPFAREAIAELVTKGGFPQLLLQPLNFDAIFAQALQELVRRQIHQLDLGGLIENAIGKRLAHVDAGDLRHSIIETFEVLNVQSGVDIDPGCQDLLDVEIALGVATTGDIAMS